MRNEIGKGFQTAIIFCLETPEISHSGFVSKGENQPCNGPRKGAIERCPRQVRLERTSVSACMSPLRAPDPTLSKR
jgi:hypothetical protein